MNTTAETLYRNKVALSLKLFIENSKVPQAKQYALNLLELNIILLM